jgi:hypothetical protein
MARLIKHLLDLDRQDVKEIRDLAEMAWRMEHEQSGDTVRALSLYNLTIRMERIATDMKLLGYETEDE